jgi:hypothetical protein
MLLRFDLGTKSKLGPFCGLAMGNPHWPGVLDLFSKSEISRSNFLVTKLIPLMVFNFRFKLNNTDTIPVQFRIYLHRGLLAIVLGSDIKNIHTVIAIFCIGTHYVLDRPIFVK